MSEVSGAGGKGLLPGYAGQESCPRVAALMHTQDASMNRKGTAGSKKKEMKAKNRIFMVSLQESSHEITEVVVQSTGTTDLYLGQERSDYC